VETRYEIIGYRFTSLVRLLSTSWIVVGLSSNLAQLLYNEPSLMVASYFLAPPCCSCLIISMNESRRCFFCCQSSTPLVLIGPLSVNTCCFDYWLWMATTTTLIGTLSILGDLGVVVTLENNMFSSEHVMYLNLPGAFSRSIFYTKTNYIRITNMYFS